MRAKPGGQPSSTVRTLCTILHHTALACGRRSLFQPAAHRSLVAGRPGLQRAPGEHLRPEGWGFGCVQILN